MWKYKNPMPRIIYNYQYFEMKISEFNWTLNNR